MRQRFLISLAAVSLLVGIVAAPALAAGNGPARYQAATTSYQVAVLDTYIHDFIVVSNPCDGSIAITGSTPVNSGYYTTETVAGTQLAGVITFTSVYDGPYSPGFTWSGSFPIAGGALSGDYTGTVTAGPTTMTAFKNHGDYVSSMGGGPDAAHSCIGKPITPDDDEDTVADGPNHGQEIAATKRSAEGAEHHHSAGAVDRSHPDHPTKPAAQSKDHPTKPAAQSKDHKKKQGSSSNDEDHPNKGHHTGHP